MPLQVCPRHVSVEGVLPVSGGVNSESPIQMATCSLIVCGDEAQRPSRLLARPQITHAHFVLRDSFLSLTSFFVL